MQDATGKISVSLTDERARMLREAVRSGDYASPDEAVRETLRAWKSGRIPGRMWDEGIAGGSCDPGTGMDDIRAEVRHRHGDSA